MSHVTALLQAERARELQPGPQVNITHVGRYRRYFEGMGDYFALWCELLRTEDPEARDTVWSKLMLKASTLDIDEKVTIYARNDGDEQRHVVSGLTSLPDFVGADDVLGVAQKVCRPPARPAACAMLCSR